MANIAFVLEETLFNGKPINYLFKEGYKSIYDDYLQILNLEMIDDKPSTVNNEIEQYCVIDQLFQVLDWLWSKSLFRSINKSETKKAIL